MNLNKIMLTAVLSLGVLAQANAASTGTLNISGSITGSACSIEGAAGDIPVNLGPVPKTAFTATGAPVATAGFPLKLTGCSPDSDVSVRFNGTPDSANTNFLQLTQEADVAQNVAVGLYEKDGKTPIAINQTSAVQKTDATGAADLYYQVGYVATGTVASVTTGPANAVAEFTVLNP
ncbi:fimbrial protein [Serratia fonticola]|uniref:fimbrial protein n=1 Tax=Serratia fonticola TaxID=47917 RepID=UPI001AEAD75A|nr:fimbrial protein [Serratia fonticola]MBP0996879.1 type 1 fimbrial protein [Serratia fonticola]MBP1001243.1 type 1 fimbrial protein [Serratia fonticola]MBP1011581.1 type 1 fimbrial protein [Serratia fonticola]MBP1036791.1 type 1 fimbrial protein [Serratia fonticola]CAI0720924.1 ELF [Serratia fonticola]